MMSHQIDGALFSVKTIQNWNWLVVARCFLKPMGIPTFAAWSFQHMSRLEHVHMCMSLNSMYIYIYIYSCNVYMYIYMNIWIYDIYIYIYSTYIHMYIYIYHCQSPNHREPLCLNPHVDPLKSPFFRQVGCRGRPSWPRCWSRSSPGTSI